MTDQRFKELLNLYLDHRLADGEAREFEQALRADAARRKILRDYTLIQGGCSELFQRAAAQAPSSAALCRSLRAVECRISQVADRDAGAWSWREWTAGVGFAGAGLAACATILIVMRTGGPADAQAPQVADNHEAVRVTNIPAVQPVATTVRPDVVVVAASAVEPVSERQRARNLTLAALGLSTDDSAIARTGKHWADAKETYELANLSPSARQWIIATSAQEGGWTQGQMASLTMQSGGVSGWSQPDGAYRVEQTGFRFER
jgi:hypothetical protein